MKKIVDEFLPILTVSEANGAKKKNKNGKYVNEHWTDAYKRHKAQKKAIHWAFILHQWDIDLPCEVILTRMSPRFLDSHDNLPTSFKFIVDSLADCIMKKTLTQHQKALRPGHSDSDPRITWKYQQEKSKIKGIRIEIYS